MSQDRLFQYAVLKHPTKEESDKGVKSVLLVPPTHVLARSEHAALMLATVAIPRAELEYADRLEVAVRPF